MRKFLKSDKFLILISVVLSVLLWFGMNFGSGSEFTKTVYDIPVTIELPQEASDNGYEIFGTEQLTASVSVTGNRMIVGSLSKADIQIVDHDLICLVHHLHEPVELCKLLLVEGLAVRVLSRQDAADCLPGIAETFQLTDYLVHGANLRLRTLAYILPRYRIHE